MLRGINKAGPALAPCNPSKMPDGDLHSEDKTAAPVCEDRVQQSSALVEIDGVKKSFGGKIALKSVSFSVPSGQICGLLGPNGAGKTTLFRLLMGILKATEGKLLIDGRDAFEERWKSSGSSDFSRTSRCSIPTCRVEKCSS